MNGRLFGTVCKHTYTMHTEIAQVHKTAKLNANVTSRHANCTQYSYDELYLSFSLSLLQIIAINNKLNWHDKFDELIETPRFLINSSK